MLVSTGIAATLLPAEKTVYKIFELPVLLFTNSSLKSNQRKLNI